MSVHVSSWVLIHSNATANDRMALLVFADKADDDGSATFPSADTIAFEGRMSRPTAVKARQRLVEQGRLIEAGKRPSGTPEFRVRMDIAAEGPPPPRKRSAEAKGVKNSTPGEGVKADGVGGKDAPPAGGSAALPEPSIEPPLEPSTEQAALATDDVPQDVCDAAELVVAVAAVKPRPREYDPAVIREGATTACLAAPGRAYRTEGERFREYWTEGKGHRRAMANPVQAWRNWLKTAPDASAYERRPRSGRPRRGPSPDEMRAAAAELRAKGR